MGENIEKLWCPQWALYVLSNDRNALKFNVMSNLKINVCLRGLRRWHFIFAYVFFLNTNKLSTTMAMLFQTSSHNAKKVNTKNCKQQQQQQTIKQDIKTVLNGRILNSRTSEVSTINYKANIQRVRWWWAPVVDEETLFSPQTTDWLDGWRQIRRQVEEHHWRRFAGGIYRQQLQSAVTVAAIAAAKPPSPAAVGHHPPVGPWTWSQRATVGFGLKLNVAFCIGLQSLGVPLEMRDKTRESSRQAPARWFPHLSPREIVSFQFVAGRRK